MFTTIPAPTTTQSFVTVPAPADAAPAINTQYAAYVDAELRRNDVLTYDSYVCWLLTEGVRYSGRGAL